jgi:bifunctional non-homologous end joining protein LigD
MSGLDLIRSPKKPPPQFVAPMMASMGKEPFDHPDWIFETKLDGFRAITVIDSADKARLWSCNQLPLEPKFPMVLDSVNQLKLRSTILDGEIVALDKDGIRRFQLLQQWQKRPTAPVVYYLFDVLWSDGRDLTGQRTCSEAHQCARFSPAGPLREHIHAGGVFAVYRGADQSIDTEFVLTSPPHGLHDLGINRHRRYD